jgi:hypothetical protein
MSHAIARFAAVGALALAVGACATYPEPGAVREEPRPLPPPPDTRVIFYPTQGQSAEQQDRDRYECYRWAVQQTGFDPSRPQLAPHQRVTVVPAPPPGANTAAGAVTGAVVGAAVSNPHNAGAGALVGAIAGAMLGASADAGNEQRAERAQAAYDRRAAEQEERTTGSFRRAMSACLGGRGYTVQ